MHGNLVEIVVTKTAGSSTSVDSTVTILKTVTVSSKSSSETAELETYYVSQTEPGYVQSVATQTTSSSGSTSTHTSNANTSLPSSSGSATSTLQISSNSATSTVQNSSNSKSAAELGMAIGIPIAVVTFFGICIFLLVLMKKKYGTKPTDLLTFKGPKDADLEKGSLQSHVNEEKPTKQAREKPPNVSLLNRLSKIIHVPETPMELKSTVLLRRFNLSKKETLDKDLPRSPASVVKNDPTGLSEAKEPDPKAHVVVRPYARRLSDELTVCAGDQIVVQKIHSDGWITVKRCGDGECGVIPLLCVQRLGEKQRDRKN